MKKQYIILALGAMLMASCADEFDRNFEVGRPDKIEKYAYLTDYKALKEYVSDPNFHLGVGTDAADYANQGVSYVVTNANFNETVAGNAMKMASCVGDDGSMNFGTVEAYVKEATKAGINVYGHTLAWHAQQPTKWLNSLLADKKDPNYSDEAVPTLKTEKRRCIRVNSEDMAENPWDTQFWLVFEDHPIHTGDTYEFSIDLMANKAATAGSQTHTAPGSYIHWEAVGTLPFTEEWTTFKSSGSFGNEAQEGGYSIAFNLNDFADANIYYFDNISLKINGEEVIKNGDCESDETVSFRTKEDRGSTDPSRIVDETEVWRMESPSSSVTVDVPRNCIRVSSEDMAENPWDTQFWLVFEDHPIHTGDTYEVKMNVRADLAASAGTQTHTAPGSYIHWEGIGTVPFTPEWTEYHQSGTFGNEAQEGGYSIAFNLNDFTSANNYYFDDISLKINGEEVIKNGDCENPNETISFVMKEDRGDVIPARLVDHYTEVHEGSNGFIPLSAEEKKEILTGAMDSWISGMMQACSNEDTGEVLVKAWDVVNEALSGDDKDGDGIYDLQHGSEDNKNDFFWQDYMGDLDYVRTAVRLARQYGGNDQKLFINDYNLESDWDQNKKLKSLIKWIEKWESDGVTRIDGIGSQMHISYYMNPSTQESKKKAIEESFKLLAASGKLVRISELDMGLVGEDGKDIATPDVTEEQHHAMAEFYTWIIKKYKEIIPAAQQWGICQWCATDSPAGSGWRANQPVGLWDQNFYRKHTYAGFADGLSGE